MENLGDTCQLYLERHFRRKLIFDIFGMKFLIMKYRLEKRAFWGLRGSPIVQYVCRIIEKICIFLSLLKFKHIMSPNISSRICIIKCIIFNVFYKNVLVFD